MPTKLTTEEIIKRCKDVHGDVYDYSDIRYTVMSAKIRIVCKEHGEFWMLPQNHFKRGDECPKCNGKVTNLTEFIKRAKEIHGDSFDYKEVIYKLSTKKVKIICKQCNGYFLQTPNNHLHVSDPQGCPTCNKGKITQEIFLNTALSIHGNAYDYSKVKIGKNIKEKVIITCLSHGDFLQSPKHHLLGHGCQICAKQREHFVSEKETKWLNTIKSDKLFRNYFIKAKYNVDGYDPETKTVYEFYGDYWHGNIKKYKPTDMNKTVGKTFGELYEKTLQREAAIKAAGYKVVSIWESDYDMLTLRPGR